MNRPLTVALTAALALAVLAGPALAAPGKKGPGGKYKQDGPQVVVVDPGPEVFVKPGKHFGPRRHDAPAELVYTTGPHVIPTPQELFSAPRPAPQPTAWQLRARLEQAAAYGRLTKRERRALKTLLVRFETAERRFLGNDGRLDRRERRVLARLEAGFELALNQAARGRRQA
jgi:hypothetical protein